MTPSTERIPDIVKTKIGKVFCVAEDDWLCTGRLLHRLKSKGIIAPLTDALIAVIANRHKMNVLTLDKHFQHLPVNSEIE